MKRNQASLKRNSNPITFCSQPFKKCSKTETLGNRIKPPPVLPPAENKIKPPPAEKNGKVEAEKRKNGDKKASDDSKRPKITWPWSHVWRSITNLKIIFSTNKIFSPVLSLTFLYDCSWHSINVQTIIINVLLVTYELPSCYL